MPVAGAAKTLAVSPMSSSTAPSQLEVKRMTAPFLAGKTIDVAKDDSASPPQNQTAVQAIPPLKLIQPVQPAQPVVPFQGVTLKDFVAFESALTAKLEKIETSLRNQGLVCTTFRFLTNLHLYSSLPTQMLQAAWWNTPPRNSDTTLMDIETLADDICFVVAPADFAWAAGRAE